ncbi:FAD-binding oxidoreductase [Terricaulis sp.]|uniref:FAD-binding oxidoreductase n=1 Tax=Terricaulis sp. TaxID=2768686 RepID=UPI003784056C
MIPLPSAFTAKLAEQFGARLCTGEAVRAQHAGGGMHLPALPPQAVLMAETLDEIVTAVRACAEFGVPIIPFGVGTSLECHVGAPRGGLCIDLSGLKRVLRVSEADQDCTVEAGLTRVALNEHLRHTGLFFPVDPGADATLGGMASTRASGTTTLRYGGMRENVLGLTVVTPQGEVVRTARRARKSAAGYDLTHLFVGAEGTLGVIADVTLRLFPIPEAASAAVCAFESTDGAVNSVIEAVQLGLPLARAEYLDDAAIRVVNAAFHTDYPAADTLFLEFHGAPSEVSGQAERFGEIAAGNGGGAFRWALETEARSQLWRARHQAGLAAAASRPGARPWSTDVCVPISRLAECVTQTKADLADAPFPAVVLGHIGDGNFHCVLLIKADDPSEVEAAARFNDALVARAIAMDGTCTGEHGIGLGKRESLREELGAAVDLMAKVKRALDPAGIMNPEKILA